MYLPEHFAETRADELQRMIRDHPLGMLVTHSPAGLDAEHLPFELDVADGGLGTLRAHIARANPLGVASPADRDVMIVFRGPQGYISRNWYPSKHEAHRQVPTWNYEIVQVHGRLRIVDDPKLLRALLYRLTRAHEAAEPRPWKMGDAPADYLDRMLQAVVGIEVEIVRAVGKRKLSQNREVRDRDGAVDVLRERGNIALAEAMAGVRG